MTKKKATKKPAPKRSAEDEKPAKKSKKDPQMLNS